MTIASELLAVLQEVGSACTILKPNGTIVTGEYLDMEDHAEHTNPQIRAFFFTMSLPYPSSAAVGDILVVGSTEPQYILLTVKAPQRFAGEIVEYSASGYLANAAGKFQYYEQDGGYDSDYNKVEGWQDLYTGVTIRGALMDRLYRSNVTPIANEIMDVSENSLHFYISDYFSDVAMGMRWVGDNGDIFKVDQIEKYNFLGVQLVFLSEDTRGDRVV